MHVEGLLHGCPERTLPADGRHRKTCLAAHRFSAQKISPAMSMFCCTGWRNWKPAHLWAAKCPKYSSKSSTSLALVAI
jgi:hypothetical protein